MYRFINVLGTYLSFLFLKVFGVPFDRKTERVVSSRQSEEADASMYQRIPMHRIHRSSVSLVGLDLDRDKTGSILIKS